MNARQLAAELKQVRESIDCLIRERNRYQDFSMGAKYKADRLERSNRALRGVITRMKKGGAK